MTGAQVSNADGIDNIARRVKQDEFFRKIKFKIRVHDIARNGAWIEPGGNGTVNLAVASQSEVQPASSAHVAGAAGSIVYFDCQRIDTGHQQLVQAQCIDIIILRRECRWLPHQARPGSCSREDRSC